MNRKTITSVAAAIALIAATGASGGCGSNGPSPTSTTHTAIQGDPDAANKCKDVLDLQHPTNKQLTATYTVTCNFSVASADISLVIQGRPLGGDNTQWDNISDPKTGSSVPITLTYTIPCITTLEYQASGSVDVLSADGSPVSTSNTAGPESYGPSECSGS